MKAFKNHTARHVLMPGMQVRVAAHISDLRLALMFVIVGMMRKYVFRPWPHLGGCLLGLFVIFGGEKKTLTCPRRHTLEHTHTTKATRVFKDEITGQSDATATTTTFFFLKAGLICY